MRYYIKPLLLFIIAVTCLHYSSVSQQYSASHSDKIKVISSKKARSIRSKSSAIVSKKVSYNSIVPANNGRFYVINNDEGKYTISLFNDKLELVSIKEFSEGNIELFSPFFINNELHILQVVREPGEIIHHFMDNIYNKTSFELIESKEIASYAFENLKKKEITGHKIIVSQDSSKLLLIAKAFSNGDNDLHKFQVYTMDKVISPMWGKEVDFKRYDPHELPSNYLISNSGVVYLIKKKNPYKRNTEDRNFSLIRITSNGIKELKKEFSSKEAYIREVAIHLDSKENLVCNSLVNIASDLDIMSHFSYGWYSFKFDKNGELIYDKIIPFKKSNIATLYSEDELVDIREKYLLYSNKDDLSIGLTYYQIKESLFIEGNRSLIIAEQNGGSNGINDLLIAMISSEGAVDWVARIPKKQGLGETCDECPFWISYFLYKKKDDIYFIHLDNIKNKTRKEGEKIKPWNVYNSYAIKVDKIDGAGEIEELYINDKEFGLMFMDNLNSSVDSNGKILMLRIRGANAKVSKLELKF